MITETLRLSQLNLIGVIFVQVPEKKLKKLETEFQQKKYQEEFAKDPINVLTEENKKLKVREKSIALIGTSDFMQADCMRLEAESDKYSNDLATLKVR